jgi:hypothetical protein
MICRLVCVLIASLDLLDDDGLNGFLNGEEDPPPACFNAVSLSGSHLLHLFAMGPVGKGGHSLPDKGKGLWISHFPELAKGLGFPFKLIHGL